MAQHRIFGTAFADIYPHYVTKAERKGRTREEVHEVITWLTGYDEPGLSAVLEQKVTMEAFFADAPELNPNAALITGSICGYKVQEIEDPLMRQIRYLDKLVDELARGKKMSSILRGSE
ncbi:hypothetical protein BJY21_004444 [Kineosphaera limosa]|uniref:DUF2200 domain-containing protein n=1 Tax=Kineosphaera limosa NBRC 100340 TaxID=1184609 RepID=K6WVU7_9MICO|nr:DUF2200 domain-containing protein [Kineosphaera limosa]NYE03260.1 hypothetical protein [Kineosphaera limosa]GAB96217.1 hypothetical protein KILIM_033_00370 [Kineosphaera limosa NBRC 100340]